MLNRGVKSKLDLYILYALIKTDHNKSHSSIS